MPNTIFHLLGGELVFTPEQLEYYEIREQFRILAEQSREKSQNEFYKRFTSFQKLIKGHNSWLKEYMVKGANLASKILAKHGHYDLDPARFISEYFDTRRLMSAANRLNDFTKSQADEHYQNELERTERTEAAGSTWFGGGFGLKGAIKGAVQAEALNLAGAALSGTFNMIGRNMESKRQLEEQEAFFKDEKTPKAFSDGIYSGLAEMYLDLVQYINKNCPEIGLTIPSHQNIDKSKSLFSNIKNHIIPEDRINENCLRVIALNPLFPDIYTYIIKRSPEDFGTLLDIDKLFKVGIVSSQLPTVLNAFYKTLDVSTEEKAMEARELMQQKAKQLGISDYSGFDKLEKLIQKYDYKYRTISGYTFESREEADKQKKLFAFYEAECLQGKYSEVSAKKGVIHEQAQRLGVDDKWLSSHFEKALEATQQRAAQKLDEFYGTLELKTETQAMEARSVLSAKAQELELHNYEFYAPLEQLINDFDRKARTVANKIFETRTEAAKQRIAYGIYCESCFIESEENALRLKAQLEEFSVENAIDISWLLSDVSMALKHFDDIACMNYGYRYSNREEAKLALTNETLFFQAVWSDIVNFVNHNSIKPVQNYASAIINTARNVLELPIDTEIYVYLNTETIASGNSGIALCSDGIHWSNGSAMISKLAGNKLVKLLFSKKANELEEKYQIKAFHATWKDFFEVDFTPCVHECKLEILPDMVFEADRVNINALCKLLCNLKDMSRSSDVIFTSTSHIMDKMHLLKPIQITPLPIIQ